MIVTEMSDTITTLKETLLDIAEAFSLSRDQLLDYERREGLELFRHCTGSQFAEVFPLNRIDSWFSNLGADLRFRVLVIDEDKSVDVGASAERPKLEWIYKKIAKTKIDHIDVRVEISKDHLTQSLNNDLGMSFNALYFFAETLTTRLTLARIQPLFDSGVLPLNSRGVVGILFCSGLLWSQYLTVVGLENLDPNHFLRLPMLSHYQVKWDQVRSMRDTNMLWQDSLKTIDPQYFQVKAKQPGLEQIEERLLGLSEILSILQFCVSISSRSDGTMMAQVSRPGGTTLEIAPDAFLVPLGAQVSSSLGSPAFQMFKWAFRGEDYDKIDLVRDLMDREVRGREGNPVAHLMLFSPELLISARAGYKALRARALESYWKARQEAKDKIDMYIVTVRSNIDKLRTDMLARAIQFFTAIVAFLAVGVFQPGLPLAIKVSGLIFSIIYIVLIGVFQLWPACINYRHLRTEAADAVDEYKVLSPSEREHIKAKLTSGRQSEFENWLVACCAVYGIELVGFIILLGVFVAKA